MISNDSEEVTEMGFGDKGYKPPTIEIIEEVKQEENNPKFYGSPPNIISHQSM